jgi:FKBP-type peptidyl-prolyl cis-trans isomerase
MKTIKQTMKYFLFALLISLNSSCQDKYTELTDGIYAEFVTNKGTMVAKLNYDKAPVTVANFISLAEGTNSKVDSAYAGKKFYNGTTFHRVIDKFMIQGGDPTATGSGNPGYKFKDEINDAKHDKPGILSMANSGPATNGSQFFITEGPTPNLDSRHTVFGELVIGLEIQDTISNVKTAARDKPVEDVVIEQLNIIRKGQEAKQFDAPKVFDDYLKQSIEEEARLKEEMETTLDDLSKDFTKTETGLRYKITEAKATGRTPKSGETVSVHYTGMLKDGTKFDSSVDRGTPLEFPIGKGRVIPGWDEGIMLLKEGEKARLVIPPYLGYGKRGAGRVIPPNAVLIFDVELVKIGK